MTHDETATAYHEAGHAVAHWLYGFPIERVTVNEEGDYAGAVSGPAVHVQLAEQSDDGEEVEQKLRQAVTIHHAGPEAQRYYDARTVESWHTDEDRDNALEVLWHMGYPPEHLELIHKALQAEAAQLVREHWRHVQTVAAALVERRELTGADVHRLLGPPPVKQG